MINIYTGGKAEIEDMMMIKIKPKIKEFMGRNQWVGACI